MGAAGPGDGAGMAARLAVVQAVTEVGLLPLDADEMLREVLERTRTGLRASTASIMLLEHGDTLVVRASAGLEVEVASGLQVPLGAGIAGRVAATGEPTLIFDIAAAHPVSGHLLAAGLRSLAAVPLTLAGSLIGVLHVGSRAEAAFDEDDLSLLAMLADRVALTVERTRAVERERAATAALRASEQRARAVLDTAVDGIITIDGTGRVDSMNPAAEQMFGYPASEVVGRNISMLMPEPYRGEHDGYLARYRRTGERRIIGVGREVVGQRRDGTTFPMEVAVSEVGSGAELFTGVVRDITERKLLEAQLAHQAVHDPLTRLANRTLLVDRLEHAVARVARHGGLLALFFLDLDRFKLINDTLGHVAGDELLVQTANRLRGALRAEDLVARLGGDEFVVLCEELTDVPAAEAVARRLVEALSPPVRLQGRELFVSASIGVITDTGQRTASEVLRDADAAMYQAKEQGRGRYTLLDEVSRTRSNGRLQLGSDLHHALVRGELQACYQPLVDLRTGEVSAAEALLRWQHPHRGILTPGAFLAVADDIGLTVDFDAWMLATACRQAVDWGPRLARRVRVWVNLSGRSLAHPQLPDVVVAALDECGLEPHLLTLELTEDALMQNAAETVRTLARLRDLGVQLAVDDFGTGYSSLAYLQQFPVHALKIDRSFISRLDLPARQAEDNAAIVRTIVSLAAALGLQTVAEGVETASQLAAVTALDCDLAQGYFLGRPAPPEDILHAAPHGVLLPHTYGAVTADAS